MKKQKLNQLYALILLVVLTACSSTPANDEELSKREQLKQYKEEVHELNQKIAELEAALKEEEEIEFVNVVAREVQPQLFEHFFEVTAQVEADQEVNVSPESSGKILEIKVKEGEQVEKGQVLAQLNTNMLNESIEELRISLDLAKTTFERQKNLWDQKIGSEIQYLQAKSNKESMERRLSNLKAQLDMAIIKAPVNGIVDVIFQKKGEIASPQMPFAKVVNIDKVKIYGDVAETYLTKIKKGNEVFINFPALDMDTKAPIFAVGNFIDPNNRTFRIRVDLSNKKGLIKPNLLAVMKIKDYEAKDALVIPSILIKEDFRGNYTYIAEKEGKIHRAKKIYVEPGVSDNNMTEILSGLQTGNLLVTEGFEQIVNGTAIKF